MKNAILIAAFALLLVSCRNEKKPLTPPEQPMTAVPADETATGLQTSESDSVVEETDGTSVKIGPDGINVKTGEVDKKTDINIKGGQSANLEVRSPK